MYASKLNTIQREVVLKKNIWIRRFEINPKQVYGRNIPTQQSWRQSNKLSQGIESQKSWSKG